jgi:hypothetical protein
MYLSKCFKTERRQIHESTKKITHKCGKVYSILQIPTLVFKNVFFAVLHTSLALMLTNLSVIRKYNNNYNNNLIGSVHAK